MIMCGAGAQHAASEVELLAETLQAPVTAFRSGRGIVPEDHALGVASVAARELWDDVDVLVGVGSRLEMPYMRWGDSMRYERKPSHGPKLIRIDIDPAEMQRFEPDVAIVADSATACRLLAERLRTPRCAEPFARRRDRRGEAGCRRGDRRHPAASRVPACDPRGAAARRHPRAGAVAGRLHDVHGRVPGPGSANLYLRGLPGHTRLRLSDGARRQSGESRQSRRVRDRRRRLHVRRSGARDGCAIRNRARDDRLQQPLVRATCCATSKLTSAGRTIGSRLHNPDFVRLAESFGVAARRVKQPRELQRRARSRARGGATRAHRGRARSRRRALAWPLIHMRKRPSEIVGVAPMMALLASVEQNALSVWVRESPSLLAFPFILYLHTLGLAMLAGINVGLDVWLLARRTVPSFDLAGIYRVMWLGFGINAAVGAHAARRLSRESADELGVLREAGARRGGALGAPAHEGRDRRRERHGRARGQPCAPAGSRCCR